MSRAQELLESVHRSDETIDDHLEELERIAEEDTPVGQLIQSWLDNTEARS